MTLATLVASAVALSGTLAFTLGYLRFPSPKSPSSSSASLSSSPASLSSYERKSKGKAAPGQGWILENTVTHARTRPTGAAHAFAYPTLAVLVALDALEAGALDLGLRGSLFGYRAWGQGGWGVTGLRAGAYLSSSSSPSVGGRRGENEEGLGREEGGLKARIWALLGEFGAREEGEGLGEVWMLTMPSYMGFEGINPLTVYYGYDAGGCLAWVVLEIHNTFGEKHVHVLEPGVREDSEPPPGYDHQWTFPREFHVSPFNDRLGHYAVAVAVPPPPLHFAAASSTSPPPRPKIRIHLYAAPSHSPPSPSSPHSEPDFKATPTLGPLKLTATLVARHAVPLTSRALIHALARHPFALFLSFARILYHAAILHYVKRLDVFPRPDPQPTLRSWESAWSSPEAKGGAESERVHGGIGWQDEGTLEAYARRVTERVLARRAAELGVRITLVSGDPAVRPVVFEPAPTPASETEEERKGKQDTSSEKETEAEKRTLAIHYTAPRFFTTLLLAPSAAHMLAMGKTEGLFWVSDESIFASVFSPFPSSSSGANLSFAQRTRVRLLPASFVERCGASDPVPLQHLLDEGSTLGALANAAVVGLLHLADNAEKAVFGLVRARFVPGMEPWRRWERAAAAAQQNT